MKLPAIISVLTLVAAMPALAQSEPANPFVAGMRSVKIEAQDFAKKPADQP